jgi:UDPglucose 6-dehydrogenase
MEPIAHTGNRIAVIGCGHVGLVFAGGLAALGHSVIGIDKRESLIADLCQGEVAIREPGLVDLLRSGLNSGLLAFTTSYDQAIPDADFVFLAVDTPSTLAGAADLRNMRSAIRSIAGSVNGHLPIVVNKSTSPIGTGETIEGLLREIFEQQGRTPSIVANPEFLRQGHAVEDFFNPDRIVVGSRSRADAHAVADLYAPLAGDRIFTDLRTAEMIKYVANSYLATRVSFINEIAGLCERIGVDIDRVIEGVAVDPRIGGHFLAPGIGFGGSCLPKDVAALRYVGETVGVATPILSAVQEINKTQRLSAVRRLRARLGTLEGRRIGVWGLTFKGGTEDTRESPAMDVVHLLLNEGADVHAYDPGVVGHRDGVGELVGERLATSAIAAVHEADALAILSDWPEFAAVPLDQVRAAMHGRVIFDGRNVLSRAAAEAAGFAYLGVGRVSSAPNRRSTDE